jgi:hypothetical protein
LSADRAKKSDRRRGSDRERRIRGCEFLEQQRVERG